MTAPRIYTLHVGTPEERGTPGAEDPMQRPWRSAIFKDRVAESVALRKEGLDGDAVADTKHHGGPDKAVCVYPLARYPHWRGRLDRELAPGAFGENFTVDGQDEENVCIGDVFAVGEDPDAARVQVSQPRSPCWKVARRWNEKQLARWFQETGFTGWYLRVLRGGRARAGQPLVLRERPHPEWTVMRANRVRHHGDGGPEAARALADCEALGESWRRKLQKRAKQRDADPPDALKRLIGQNAD